MCSVASATSSSAVVGWLLRNELNQVPAISLRNAGLLGENVSNTHNPEDPLDSRDLTGHAQLAEALDTPIATGEHEYGVHGFETLLDTAKPDVVLVDLGRVGGVRDFNTVAEVASEQGIGVVSYCNPEQSLQVMAAAPKAMYVDQLTWWEPLYVEHIEFDDGYYLVPDRPGFGFSFIDDVVERFAV